MELKELVHKVIYSSADLHSQIPDVNQMAEKLFDELKPQDTDADIFLVKFLEHMGQEELLESAFFDGVIGNIDSLCRRVHELGRQVLISSWTQGNVFLQTKKAQVFQKQLPKNLLATPSIYASVDKIGLLPNCYKDLKDQGCDQICLIDDRLANVLGSRKILEHQRQEDCPVLFIHKIRPDKPVTHRLQQEDENLYECKDWCEIEDLVTKKEFKKLGLILDKDGVIFNSTNYRKSLEKSLCVFAESFLEKA